MTAKGEGPPGGSPEIVDPAVLEVEERGVGGIGREEQPRELRWEVAGNSGDGQPERPTHGPESEVVGVDG